MEHAQNAQFYAPTEASKKEFWLYPAIILHLFVLSKDVGHYEFEIWKCSKAGFNLVGIDVRISSAQCPVARELSTFLQRHVD